MSYYDDRPKDLIQDTKDFLRSDYGRYVMSTIKEMSDGHLSGAANIDLPHPERYAAKYSALKEVTDFVNSPLDDDTPSQGN